MLKVIKQICEQLNENRPRVQQHDSDAKQNSKPRAKLSIITNEIVANGAFDVAAVEFIKDLFAQYKLVKLTK